MRIQNDYFGGFITPLNDAVVNEWACTKIRVLDIAVAIAQDGRYPTYLADWTMETWTEQDHSYRKMLDRFYTQTGSLKELEVLSIRCTGRDFIVEGEFGKSIPFRDNCLPVFLVLEEVTTEHIRYLSRWSGLTKLRDLRGSFLWTNSEARARMGEREVEWFATHLPALRRAAFLGVPFKETLSNDIPVILQDLHSRRPELQLDYDLEDGHIGRD